MPSGQIIGRISIRVLPDTSNFRRDVKAQLTAIEKNLKFVIATSLDMTGAKRDLIDGIRKLDAEHRKVTIRAQVDFDKLSLDHVTATLNHWQRSHDPVKVKVEPNMMPGATALIAARMDVATRPRTLSVIPKLSSSGIAGFSAQVGTMLAALSGARLLSSTFSNIWSMFQNLDKMIPLISAISMGLVGLVGLGLSAASNLFALSVSLAQIGVLGLALPGILTGIGIGLGITLIAMKGLKAALPDVYKQFQDMKTLITKDFWSGASAGIRNLATVFLPQLGTTAKAVGTFWGTLANALSKPFHTALAPMFDALNKSIQISTGSAGVFASIITQLGLTGASYLPRLAQWFTNISTQFDNFLKRVRADGSLKAWTDAGLTALHDLGSVVSNLGGILAGISRAATVAGGSGLGVLASALERIHKVVDTPAFQTGLTDVLRSAHTAMTLIVEKSGPAVSKFFETFAKTLTIILPIAGSAIGTALKAIASALSQPAVQTGLIAMFDGIRKGIEGLAPVLPTLGVALGKLGEIIGALAKSFGPTLAVFFKVLLDCFLALEPAITKLIPILGTALLRAWQALAPALVAVAKALAPVIGALGTALAKAVTVLAPHLAEIADALGKAIVDALIALTPYIGPLVTAFTDLVIAVIPLLPEIIKLIPPLVNLAIQVLPIVTQALQILATVLPGVIGFIKWLGTTLDGVKSTSITVAFSLITQAIANCVIYAKNTLNWFGSLPGLFSGWFNSAKDVAIGAFNSLVSFIGGIPGRVASILNWFGSLPGMFSGWFNSASSAVQGILNALVSFVMGIPGRIANGASPQPDEPCLGHLGCGGSGWAG